MSREVLTERQARFVQFVLSAPTIAEAAVRAGYSPRTADSQASQLLKIPKVAQALAVERALRAKKARRDSNWVRDNLVSIAERCMQATPVLNSRGVPTGEYSFDSRGAIRALELVGRDLGMWPAQAIQVNDYRTQVLAFIKVHEADLDPSKIDWDEVDRLDAQ